MATTPTRMLDEIDSKRGFALQQSDCVYNLVLAAGVAEVVTIPATSKYVVFSSTGDFWMRMGAAADAPAADVSDGSGSELNPGVRVIPSGTTTLGLEADAACKVSMMFYQR